MPYAYKVEINKETLLDHLDNVELLSLIDNLIAKQVFLASDFELFSNGNEDAEFVIDKIIHAIKKDDKRDITRTYDILVEFLSDNNKSEIVDILESSPDIDPEITICLNLARPMRMKRILLPKIMITFDGNWRVVARTLGLDNVDIRHNSKEYVFKIWFNTIGTTDGGLLKLVKAFHLHSDICFVNWKLLQKFLKESEKY